MGPKILGSAGAGEALAEKKQISFLLFSNVLFTQLPQGTAGWDLGKMGGFIQQWGAESLQEPVATQELSRAQGGSIPGLVPHPSPPQGLAVQH